MYTAQISIANSREVKQFLCGPYASALVRQNFPEPPKTKAEMSIIQQWLVLQRAKHAVERQHAPKIATMLSGARRQAVAAWRKTQDYTAVDHQVRKHFSYYLPARFIAMYRDAARQAGPLITLFSRTRRKADSDIIDPWTIPELQTWANTVSAARVTMVTNATMRGIARIVQAGMANNWTIDEVSDSLRASYGFSEVRAQRIARTEVQSASMKSQYTMGQRMYNPTGLTKTWVATNDHRTRKTHVTAGQTQKDIPYTEPFVVGGSKGMFPGDPALPARELINCRCAFLTNVQILPFDF